jgi:hypothetical protein
MSGKLKNVIIKSLDNQFLIDQLIRPIGVLFTVARSVDLIDSDFCPLLITQMLRKAIGNVPPSVDFSLY